MVGALACRQAHFPSLWHVLFSGQIWKTEDVKMSLPRQAAPEEPWALPPSPRGNCPGLAQPSLPSSLLGPGIAAPPRPAEPREAIEPLGMLRGQDTVSWWSIKLCRGAPSSPDLRDQPCRDQGALGCSWDV